MENFNTPASNNAIFFEGKNCKLTNTSKIDVALIFLAARCDGATSEDGAGFNKVDANFGKSLAERVEFGKNLSAAQYLAAHKMLRKYRKQLQRSGLELPELEALVDELAGMEQQHKVVRLPVKNADAANKSTTQNDLPLSVELTDKPWSSSKWRERLGEQQLQAFDLTHEWFFNQPDKPFVLTGFGGSGKSFVVQRIVHSIREMWGDDRRLRVALVSPTHKATRVLMRFAEQAGLNNMHIGTLHSLLHVMPGKADENGKTKLEINSYSQEPHYREFGLVVVDEASMIGEELLSFVPSDVPTIFMGDRAQLAPVEDEVDGEPKDSPIFDLPCGISLTQVMRYDGAIANYATAIRQDITAQFSPRVETDGNLTKIRDKTEWEASVIQAFSQIDLQNQPDDVRALAWTNKRVAELNELIHNHFFDTDQEFCQGERLMAKEPIIRSGDRGKKQVLMQTCAECTIEKVTPGNGKIKVNGQRLEFDSWHLEVTTDLGQGLELATVAQSSWDEVKALIGEFKKSILACDNRTERKEMWRDYYQVLEYLNLVVKGNALLHRLQYAHALTIHQSQGSTFKHVFVDQSNVWGCRQPKTRNQLLYVSTTRASEHLTIYSKV